MGMEDDVAVALDKGALAETMANVAVAPVAAVDTPAMGNLELTSMAPAKKDQMAVQYSCPPCIHVLLWPISYNNVASCTRPSMFVPVPPCCVSLPPVHALGRQTTPCAT